MRVNYNGLHAHSWQILWVSPCLADVEWGVGRRDPSQSTDFCAAKCNAVVASVFLDRHDLRRKRGHTPSRPGPLEIQAVRSWRTPIGRWGDQIGPKRGGGKRLRAALCLPVEMGTHIESKSRLRRKR